MTKPNDMPAWVEALAKLSRRPEPRVTRTGYAVVVPASLANAASSPTPRFARGSEQHIDSQIAVRRSVEVTDTKELVVSETMGWAIHGPRLLDARHTRSLDAHAIDTPTADDAPPSGTRAGMRAGTRSMHTRILDAPSAPAPAPRSTRTIDARAAARLLEASPAITGSFVAEPPRRRAIGRWLALASVGVLAAATTMTGIRMWREARVTPPPVPAGVVPAGDDRLELAPDRRAIVRVGRDGTRWTSIQPAPVDTMKLAGPLLLGLTSSTLVAVELERGTTRFAWEVPAGERWATPSISVVDSCLAALTIRGKDAVLHCLDLTTGAPRWTATITGGHECVGPAVGFPDGLLVQCHGWSTVVDAKTGKVGVEAGGVGLVQAGPPILLREDGRGRLVLSTWSTSSRRFHTDGTILRGTAGTASSVVQRGQRLVIRASSASEQIATIVQKSRPPTTIAVPELQLADDVPLVRDCDLETPPRFQLLVLAPRAGTTFDPELASTRVLALLDADAGRIAWTSRRIGGHRLTSSIACRHGHYFVGTALGLWILDATTGETTAAFRFAGDAAASFAAIDEDQIGAEQILAVGRTGVTALRWREHGPSAGIEDGRVDLERELGRLP